MLNTVEENLLLAGEYARLAYQHLQYARLGDQFKDAPKMGRKLEFLQNQAEPLMNEIQQVRKDYAE